MNKKNFFETFPFFVRLSTLLNIKKNQRKFWISRKPSIKALNLNSHFFLLNLQASCDTYNDLILFIFQPLPNLLLSEFYIINLGMDTRNQFQRTIVQGSDDAHGPLNIVDIEVTCTIQVAIIITFKIFWTWERYDTS